MKLQRRLKPTKSRCVCDRNLTIPVESWIKLVGCAQWVSPPSCYSTAFVVTTKSVKHANVENAFGQ